MKEFFLVLFLSNIVLLTPEPIDLFGETVLNLTGPLKAITSGAGIEIDVSSIVHEEKLWDEDILGLRENLNKRFPVGTVRAILHTKNGRVIELNDGHYAHSKHKVWLLLSASQGVPTGIEFDKVVIITNKVTLKGVKVLWRNYKH